MMETTFFTRGKHKGNERKITLASATCLCGAAPAKSKRIKMSIRMPLTGHKMSGMPEWISRAMTFVAETHGKFDAEAALSGFELQFSDENLFKSDAVAVQPCQLQRFVFDVYGDADDPDVEMKFVAYAPFTTELWEWCGQMTGETFFARFTQLAQAESEEEPPPLVLASGEDEVGADEPDEPEEE